MAKTHASQCGYCTPGIVMSLYGLLKLNPSPSLHDIEEGFDGNLCRCTGYRPIFDCARTFANETSQSKCCSSSATKLFEFLEFKPYDPNLDDVAFPASLVKCKQEKTILIEYNDQSFDEKITWVEPLNIKELIAYKSKYPDSKIIAGNTEIGIEMKFKNMNYKTFINVSNIVEMRHLTVKTENGKRYLEIGVNITLTELIDSLKNELKHKETYSKPEISLFNAMLANLKWFASKQIRNFATLAGNIVTGSPISDLNPILMANNAVLSILTSENKTRRVDMRKFYLSYRKNDLKTEEVLLNVQIPLPCGEYEFVKAYKQSKRRDDDIAIVNACFRVKLTKNNKEVIFLDLKKII
jgi:xanthine dehydrogenase/oxidase